MKTALYLLGATLLLACGEETEPVKQATLEEATNPIELSIPEFAPQGQTVTSVQTIDRDKFLGTWYEVSSIVQWFQAFCVEGVRAQYAVRDDGNISVTNSCFDVNEELRELVGVAGAPDDDRNAELQVSFVSDDPTKYAGDYWVLSVDEDYSLAVIGEPSREFGWILSRTPYVTQEQLSSAFEVFAAQGYDIQLFELTDQAVYGEQ